MGLGEIFSGYIFKDSAGVISSYVNSIWPYHNFMMPPELKPFLTFCVILFQDLLVCSHLSDTDLANIHCFLRCHGVLDLAAKQYMDKLLVWKELQYPACGKHFPAERCQLVYSRAPCRRILLVVGMVCLTSS